MRLLPLFATLALAVSSAAGAATLNESDITGGFSSTDATPTTISDGFETITGAISGAEDDYLHFTNIAVGAQQLDFTFDFANPNPVGLFDSAFGQVQVSESDPSTAATIGVQNYALGFFNIFPTTQTLTFNLDSSFAGGDLYVSILSTLATQEYSYGIAVPGNATIAPAPVPLPAAGLLMLAALGGFAALRGRKGAPAAA